MAHDRAPYAELAEAGLVDRIMTRPKLPLVRSFIGSASARTPSGPLASDHGAVTSVPRVR